MKLLGHGLVGVAAEQIGIDVIGSRVERKIVNDAAGQQPRRLLRPTGSVVQSHVDGALHEC